MQQTEQNLLPWLMLKSVPGVGNLIFKRLIERFGCPEAVFHASPEELSEVPGINRRQLLAIGRFRAPDRLRRELELAMKKGYRLLPLTAGEYPPLLKEIPDPPPYLYVRGRLPATGRNIAVVGSRHATDYGLRTTGRLCRDLAGQGWTVVSGMALGIDTAAHRGALAGGGPTVAVLGSGLDRIYPAENRRLYHHIAENGAVVSELPLRAEPDAHHFPARNRIISGMSLGTVVVEAAKQSGSLITARLAAEQNREVFAVPGSVQSYKSSGTHHLIKQGAKLVEQTRDILEELQPILPPPASEADPMESRLADLSEAERVIATALGPYPVQFDDLARKTRLPAAEIATRLLSLELKGIVRQLPGKHFSIADPAE